ncbi:hypothetical protein [Povalibacter sp.]|uniref:hypothetical protein n=1 Tax=Povalibacter sp. TaxID=1962978 RepID=UPI002F3EEBEC
MPQKLLTVADSFQLHDLPLVVAPGPRVSEFDGPGDVMVEISRPDGTTLPSVMTLSFSAELIPGDEARWICAFRELRPADVPIGSEVWFRPTLH